MKMKHYLHETAADSHTATQRGLSGVNATTLSPELVRAQDPIPHPQNRDIPFPDLWPVHKAVRNSPRQKCWFGQPCPGIDWEPCCRQR